MRARTHKRGVVVRELPGISRWVATHCDRGTVQTFWAESESEAVDRLLRFTGDNAVHRPLTPKYWN
jgi:hypothetical protein